MFSLTQIAAERCTTAQEAIQLMGNLAEQYGYYGDGEALLIADKNEGWLLEICGDPSGTRALWVAKKIPDDTVTVLANEYRIRDIIPCDPGVRYSSHLFKIAKAYHFWDFKKGPLDWLQMVSDGEINHPYYSLRRVLRIYSVLNPSLHLSPRMENGYTRQYPFAIKNEKKVSIEDFMTLYRDHHEGTPFDLTRSCSRTVWIAKTLCRRL